MIWLTLLIFLAILAILILVHELGHFLTARWLGVKVEEFGIGFPPRLIKLFQRKGTIYSLNWIPLGGFVKIKGEQGDHLGESDSFANKKIWQRALIIVSGVAMNVVLTAILLSIGFNIGAPQILEDSLGPKARVANQQIQIFSVLPNTPAEKGGLELGDVVVYLDGQSFDRIAPLQDYINSRNGVKIEIIIRRGNELAQKTIAPIGLTEGEPAILGVELVQTGLVSYPWYQAVWIGVKTTGYLAKEIVIAFYSLIKNLIVHQEVAVELAGPVGIAIMTGEMAKMGFIYLLQFLALLSLNLAIINFLPFPALDGGRFLFLIIEKFRGRAANQKLETLIHNIGFTLLIFLVLVVTYRDVMKWGDRILQALKNLVV
ncbi:MAG: RIP metalloprotease RseP [bacterium]